MSELLNKLKTILKITALSATAGYATQATAQTQKQDENVITISRVEQPTVIKKTDGKFDRFEDLEDIIGGLSLLKNTEYVMNVDDWRNDSTINMKRVDGELIHHYNLTTVMESREGQKGDIVNLNSSKSRMFIFQSKPNIGKDLIRYMYCSNNKDLHNFAAKYIPNTPENKAIMQNVRKLLYDEENELKTGEKGEIDRKKAMSEMAKLKVIGISLNGNTYSNVFIQDFKRLCSTHYSETFDAEKEFAVAFYPLYNARKNVPAGKAQTLAKSQKYRDASCISLGQGGLYLSSSIAFGCNSMQTLNEPKVKATVEKCNRCNYITLDAARHMALAGYKGAEEMYLAFRQKIKEDQQQILDKIHKILEPDLTQKTDAIPDYRKNVPIRGVQPLNIQTLKKNGRE